MNRSSNSHELLSSVLRATMFLALNRSLSYPFNLQHQFSRISLSDLTSSPLPSLTNNSPRMDSDDSTNTVLTPYRNLIIQSLTPRTNSRTLRPARPLFRNALSNLSRLKLPIPLLLHRCNPNLHLSDKWLNRPFQPRH